MKKRFLRWWYRVTGQKAEAEELLCYAISAVVFDDGKGLRLWEDNFSHILDVYKERDNS